MNKIHNIIQFHNALYITKIKVRDIYEEKYQTKINAEKNKKFKH